MRRPNPYAGRRSVLDALSEKAEQTLAFAEEHLQPFYLKGDEIVPQLCPFCRGGRNRDRNTFALNLHRGTFNCKRGSCNAKGGIKTLAALFGENIADIKPTAKKGVNPFDKIEKIYQLPQVELLPLTDDIISYFESRKISKQTLEQYKVASDKDGNIVFPFYYKGRMPYVKFRRPRKPQPGEPKEWQYPQTQPMLWGMDECAMSLPLVITEGVPDSLSLLEAGVLNVVSVPSGTENFDWVNPCWDFLEQFDKIVLFGDMDAPGKEMVDTLVRRLGEDRCWIIHEYPLRPDGKMCKDANEILYFHGPDKLEEVLDTAEAVPVKGLVDLGDVVPLDPTTEPRIKFGIPRMDAVLGGLHEGDVFVVTGASASGKSTLSGPILLNAIEQGKTVCAYSGELSTQRFQQWINLQAAGSDYLVLKHDPIKDKDVPYVLPQISDRIRQWYKGRFLLFDNTETFDYDEQTAIINVFTMAARRYGASVFLVDNLMTSVLDSDDEMKAQASFVNALKKFAKRFKAAVLLVAHPRKTKEGSTIGKDDVKGSSTIVALSDGAVVVERPDLRIIKNRDEGMEYLIECCYLPDCRRIYQADRGDTWNFSWDKSGMDKLITKRANSLPEYQVQVSQNKKESPF